MKTTKHLTIKTALRGMILFFLMSNSSCFSPTPDASPAQAVAARTAMQLDQQYISNALQDFSTILNQFTQHPGAKMLVDELYIRGTPVFPFRSITAELLSPHYGEYQETTPGVFELVSTLSHPGIIVNYANGMHLRFTSLDFDTQTDELNNLNLTIVSSSSVPANQAIEANLDYGYSKDATGLVEGIKISGKIKYVRDNITPVYYQVLVYTGAFNQLCHYTSPFRSTCELATSGDYVKGRGIQFSDQLNGTNWLDEEFILFTRSSLQGIWLAKQASKHFRRYNTENYAYYDIDLKASDTSNFSVPELASYSVSSQMRSFQPVESYMVVVAKAEGGPYTCDLNNTTASGTGIPLTLIWADEYSEPMLPSPALDCSGFVWVR